MKFKKMALLVIALTASAAYAETSPNWNYIEAGYLAVDLDVDGADSVSMNGLQASGFASINDHSFITIEHARVDRDGFDIKQTSIGAGLKKSGFSVAKSPTDIWASVQKGKISAGGSYNGYWLGKSDDGYWLVKAGFRSMPSNNVEIGLTADYQVFDEDDVINDNITGVTGHIRYFLDENVALYGNLGTTSDYERYGVGMTYSF